MRYSLKLFTWLRIPVYLHWSFGLILAYIAYLAYTSQESWLGISIALLMFTIIFGCVLLHEYGHAIAARKFGVSTKDIILTPIGGIARLNGMPQKPLEEFVVAIAGPLVNVAIVLILLFASVFLFGTDGVLDILSEVRATFVDLIGSFAGESQIPDDSGSDDGLLSLFSIIVTINCFLFAFNLIPAFPMDGGRIFRALLEFKIGKLQATKFASFAGQMIALLFIYQGFQNQPHTLALIGVFIFFAARKEYRDLLTHTRFKETQIKTVMQSDFLLLPSHLTIGEAKTHLEGHSKKPLILTDSAERPFASVDLGKLRTALNEQTDSLALAELAIPFESWVKNEATLDSLYGIFRKNSKSVLGVISVEDATFVGIIEPHDVQKAIKRR